MEVVAAKQEITVRWLRPDESDGPLPATGREFDPRAGGGRIPWHLLQTCRGWRDVEDREPRLLRHGSLGRTVGNIPGTACYHFATQLRSTTSYRVRRSGMGERNF